MSCPECERIQLEYLTFRKAFASFAETLNQLERTRLRIRDEQNVHGLPTIKQFKPIILAERVEEDSAWT